MVDTKKRIVCRSILSRGAEHDSSAFKASSLHELLLSKSEEFLSKGLHVIGDSAHALRSFLVTPFDNAVHGSFQDNFNFHNSASRIYIECAFGEIDQFWGIFWKPLKFSLKENVKVIDAAMRLHNFIIDWRETHEKDTTLNKFEAEIFDDECLAYLTANPEAVIGVYGREEEVNMDLPGRPRDVEARFRKMGEDWRRRLCDAIARKKLIRPRAN